MKLFTASQIRNWDIETIHQQNIGSAQLMERAASRCTEWLTGHLPKDALFVVLCGMGNNGGDGLVIARLLRQQGYGVKAFVLRHSEQASRDHLLNAERLSRVDASLPEALNPGTFITGIPPHIVVIDAIMGTGMSRPLQGWLAEFINRVNEWPNLKISIDMPSGLPADEVWPSAPVLRATHTLTFQSYKRSFLHPESGPCAGHIHVLDIGLSASFLAGTHSQYYTIDRQDALSFYRPRQPFSHKGTYGTALIAGGSYGMMGAAQLALKAAARGGAGKVQALVPECGYAVLQTAIPEVMVRCSGSRYLQQIDGWEECRGIGIGPGMGTAAETVQALAAFLEACKQPVVLDADALNILGRQKEWLARLPAGSILTPHPKEFERLFGSAADSLQRVELGRAMAMKYNIYLVLKDRYSAVVTPDGECWYNLNGNAGMATGGSGDVLCGLITALLAQDYEPKAAALLGVYLHGAAGDAAAARQGQEAMIAGDIVACLGEAFRSLSV